MGETTAPPIAKRRYIQKQRAAQQAETRRRIVETTVALHQELGPAATPIAEIARRAGVQRATIYNHFPEDGSLLAACSVHWRGLYPMPDPRRWVSTSDPGERVRLGLRELSAWFRETRAMTEKVLRDAQTLPSLYAVIEPGLLRNLERVAETLAEAFGATGKRQERILLAARAASDFYFWRTLEPLGDAAAAELGAGVIELAAR